MELNIIFFKAGDDYAYIESSGLSVSTTSKLIQGERVSDSELSFNFDIKRKSKKFPDIMGKPAEIYVSEKLKIILEQNVAAVEVNFIEVLLLDKYKYFLINSLNNPSCFDWEKSEYSTYSDPNVLRKVSRLVLKDNLITNRTLFRVKEFPKYIIIKEQIKEQAIKNNITG